MNTRLNKEQHAIQILNNPEQGSSSMRHSVLFDLLSAKSKPSKKDMELIGFHDCEINQKMDSYTWMISEFTCFMSNLVSASKDNETNLNESDIVNFIFDVLSSRLNYYVALEVAKQLEIQFDSLASLTDSLARKFDGK